MNLDERELFPYQIEGSRHLSKLRFGLLFDEMGLGKSVQAIRAAELVAAKKVLIVCRAVARRNWENEVLKWSDTFSRIYCVFDRSNYRSIDYQIVICSYELLEFVLAKNENYDVLIVDEAHYIKEPNAKRTKHILGKLGAVRKTKQAWFLTGTPCPNHFGELWPLLYTAGRTSLSYERFLDTFCLVRETGFGRQICGSRRERAAELRALLSPIMLRRTKEEVNLELPPIFYQDLIVPAGQFDIRLCRTLIKWLVPVDRMNELESEMKEQLGIVNGIVGQGKNRKITAEGLKALGAASKSVSTLRQYIGMQKVEAAIETVKTEMAAGAYKKIVLFAIHRDVIEALRFALKPKYGAVSIYGGSDPAKVASNVDRFQNTKEVNIIVANINAAGTSLNFTAADQVLFVEQDWVPGNNQQAAARCHRIGQTKPVTVRFMGVADSFDQYLSTVLRRKAAEISSLFDADVIQGELKAIEPKLTNLLE